MGHDNQASGSSGILIVVLFLVGFAVLAGVCLVGIGGWFYLRTGHQQQAATEERAMAEQQAEVARQQAETAEQQARQLIDEAMAQAHALPPPAEFDREVVAAMDSGRQLTIELDKQGQLTVDGESTDLGGLTNKLRAIVADEGATITVNVRADNECPFQHAAAVISSCQQLGISRFRIQPLEPPDTPVMPEIDEPATVIK
jgi:biopolymer transport protein ExbD